MESIMKNIFAVLSLVTIAGVILVLMHTAQAKNQPKSLVYLGEYKVKPDKVDEFESVMKDFVKEMEKYDMPYTFRMFSTDIFVYYSLNEFDDYSMLDKFNADWGVVEEKIGVKTMERYHEVEFGAIDSFKGTLLKYRPDHSFVTDSIFWKKDENSFVHWLFCYLEPSMRQEWISIQKKWLKLYRSKNIIMPFLTFTGDIGYEMPVWIYVRASSDRGDYFSELEKINTVFGEKGEIMLKQSLPLIKRIEVRHTIYRPDLSYLPER